MHKIAVLMTCHNRKVETLNSLKSLFQQDRLGLEFTIKVFLVDDGSTDGTSNAVAELFPAVQLLRGDGELFWNRGMFMAWKSASGEEFEHFLWLNDDTCLYEFALVQLIASAAQTNNQAIICGCIESPLNPGVLTYGGGKHQDKKYIPNYPDGSISRCDIINGNCVLVPSFVFKRVGNLDWRYRHGIGDNDYSLRAKKLGILSYTSALFVGSCARNEHLQKWCSPRVSIQDRMKNLYSPLGNPPLEYFVFERRHFGVLTAIKHLLSTHLRVLLPGFWKN